jgi:DNA-directed RNA polymerase subunit H (RpoH/RPB5)
MDSTEYDFELMTDCIVNRYNVYNLVPLKDTYNYVSDLNLKRVLRECKEKWAIETPKNENSYIEFNDKMIIVLERPNHKELNKKNSEMMYKTIFDYLPENHKDKTIFLVVSRKKNLDNHPKMIVYYMDDILYNPLDHECQSNYLLIDDSRKQALLERYNIKETNIPRMDITDAVSVYLGFYSNYVVEIEKNTKMNGLQKYYRIVK